MSVIAIPKSLREKLGEDATEDLIAVLEKFEESSQKNLSTKEDINSLKLEIADIRAEIKLIKWMLGVVIAGIVSLILKAFF